MIESMTGFGKSILENDNFKVECEVKSLNSKSLDLKIKLNNITAEQELSTRNLISQLLKRGKIDCNINIESKAGKGKYRINPDIFDKYYKQFSNLNKKYGTFVEEVNFYEILMGLPEVIENEEVKTEEFWNIIYDVIKKATENLIKFRKQEGNSIEKDLDLCISKISESLNKIPDFENERIEIIRKKLKSAIEENNLKIEKDRFESEIIYYLEKFDINEEKTRLANHLKYFNESKNEPECGKKLSFIAQEIGREINTIGSKSNHFEIQKLVVGMKDELEKIKEQVLNIL